MRSEDGSIMSWRERPSATKIITAIITGITGISTRVSSALPSSGEKKNGDTIKNTRENPAIIRIIFIIFVAILNHFIKYSISLLYIFAKVLSLTTLILYCPDSTSEM